MAFEIKHGDCLEVMRGMADNSVDAIVTDPPYGLSFMGKRWDYDVPSIEVWAECLRVLKPGGHLLAFAGTRTQHRMAVRIEDAGFEIRDMIAWVYGSGFPKSLDVSKAIDKAAGAEREVIGANPNHRPLSGAQYEGVYAGGNTGAAAITAPATEAARQWQGWGTALKPALEPITVARKPFSGTVAANVLEHGTGALNIDGCRVSAPGETIENHGRAPTSNGWDPRMSGGQQQGQTEGQQLGRWPANLIHETLGRWPANLIHDGSEEVVGMFPVTGPSREASGVQRMGRSGGIMGAVGALRDGRSEGHSDSGGSAARFFYCAKASKADRDEGLEGFAEKQQEELAAQAETLMRVRENGTIGVNPYLGNTAPKRNAHPTVKPTALMRYLCRLVTPPGGTVLDPFMGSGSTGKAAMLEGFDFIGIEREAEYVAIAEARIVEAQRSLGLFA